MKNIFQPTFFAEYLFALCFVLSSGSAKAQSLKPVIPLDTTWKMPPSTVDLNDGRDIIQSNATTAKALSVFKDGMTKLARPLKPTDQVKEISNLRQASLKLGPKARMIAELTAARVLGGLSLSGGRAGKPSGNWRQHLLAACNAAAKIDEKTHEKTALQAVTMWRRIEAADAPWSAPPIDAKAQRQFEFNKAMVERQALYEWSKNNQSGTIKKYNALAANYNATPIGAAIDLRIVELERLIYQKDKQLRRWQKTLIDTENKYQDKQFLGSENESKVERVKATVAKIHRDLIDTLIKDAMRTKASDSDQKSALYAIENYLGTNINDGEKQRVRTASGEIQYIAGNHKAAANTFAALASETTGPKSVEFWRKAIRSQTILAKWPVDVPWNGIPKGDMEPREVLLDMYKKTDAGSVKDWPIVGHVGLLLIANARGDEAFKLWNERLQKFPAGVHAARASGWMITAHVAEKQWDDVESLGRILVKANLAAMHLTKTYKPKDVLGLALLEGGLTALEAKDFKKSITKLDEYVKGWRGDSRHDQGLYHLGLAYHGDRQFRIAVTTLITFTKSYTRSKWRHDALVNGGAWSLALTWEDHVMYFLETHALEFPKDQLTINSLQTLADLYMGREIYDSAMRVMTILVTRNDLDGSIRSDLARRLLDTSDRRGAPESTLRLADKLMASFKDDSTINGLALSVKARIFAERKNLTALTSVEKQISGLDQSQPLIAEMISETRFLLAEASAKDKFKDEVFSLGTKDPKEQLERGFSQFSDYDKLYKSACLGIRTGWCGPALHRTARIGEQFLRAYYDLDIAKTLDPEEVNAFRNRKKSIMETVENMTMESDEKSLDQVRSGATNPDWTSAILWQNGGDWSHSKSTDNSATHFIQWHVR